jgi:hypothetical protein
MARRLEIVAGRRKKLDLAILESVTEDLRLSSLFLSPPRLEEYVYRYKIVLPLLSGAGEEVFTEQHLLNLFDLFEERCGGSLASSGVAHPAWFGSYRPDAGAPPVKDYHTVIYVYTRPIDAADRFFQLLKSILKKAGYEEQEEILMERAPMWLVETVPLPGKR